MSENTPTFPADSSGMKSQWLQPAGHFEKEEQSGRWVHNSIVQQLFDLFFFETMHELPGFSRGLKFRVVFLSLLYMHLLTVSNQTYAILSLLRTTGVSNS